MMVMRWKTDHAGRLVVAWERYREFRKTVLPAQVPHTGIRCHVERPGLYRNHFLGILECIWCRSFLRRGRWLRRPWSGAILLILLGCLSLYAQDGGQDPVTAHDRPWEIHFQSTIVGQGVLPFPADYSGVNSLEPHGEVRDTFSFDVTGRVRLWRGGEFLADVLSWQGYGLSRTTGVAGFPNGEAYRVGKTFPDAIVTRAYLRQTVPLGENGSSAADPEGDPGRSKRERRLVLTAGHLPAVDIFDKNAYANDPRTQFMNWALVNNAAWDYPANSLGFTNGASAELDLGSWTARAGIFQVSRVANALRMDWNLLHAWSLGGELEKRQSFRGHPGAVRLLAYKTRAHMGNYQASLADPQNISVNGQLGYRSKCGFGVNLDQEIRKDLGAFARLGWSDGKNQTWEFTDVDRTASVGLSLKGEAWGRPGDTLGFGASVNGISSVHRQFLAAGGLGITVGDGKLNYGEEEILEAYYSLGTRWHVSISPDFQFVAHPAYNRDRGPVAIYAMRVHWER